MELTWNIPQELNDSEVVKQAVKLAKQMICTKHCARIMLLYNCEEVKSQEGLKLRIYHNWHLANSFILFFL